MGDRLLGGRRRGGVVRGVQRLGEMAPRRLVSRNVVAAFTMLPATGKVAFDLADTSKNGQLSEPEAANAVGNLRKSVWIHSPPPGR